MNVGQDFGGPNVSRFAQKDVQFAVKLQAAVKYARRGHMEMNANTTAA